MDTITDGSHYVGEYKNGKGNGQGTHTLVNGQKYVGEFKDNSYFGQGKFTWPNGEFLEGYFENSNLINGFMDRTYNGSHYAGEIKAGKKNGLGINTFPNGRVQEGFWKNDQFQYTQDIGSPRTITRKEPEYNDENSNGAYNQIPDDKEITASSGSGFAVSDDGYIITNNHVIDQCQSVVIHFEGEEIPATVVSYDTQNDLALLKGNFLPQTVFPLSNSRPELL
uniref:trypsin-like peptidase domain-containing protein n=1 Tax=Pseudemcibacter sp. TaxID=2943293 RepID=UPI003F6A2C60